MDKKTTKHKCPTGSLTRFAEGEPGQGTWQALLEFNLNNPYMVRKNPPLIPFIGFDSVNPLFLGTVN